MTQQIKTKYQWLEDFINGFEDLEDKTHNARVENIKTRDLISHQENTFKQCLEDIHKRMSQLEAYNNFKEEDLSQIKQELYEIYQRLGKLETQEVGE